MVGACAPPPSLSLLSLSLSHSHARTHTYHADHAPTRVCQRICIDCFLLPSATPRTVADQIRYLSLHDNKYIRYFSSHKDKYVAFARTGAEGVSRVCLDFYRARMYAARVFRFCLIFCWTSRAVVCFAVFVTRSPIAGRLMIPQMSQDTSLVTKPTQHSFYEATHHLFCHNVCKTHTGVCHALVAMATE